VGIKYILSTQELKKFTDHSLHARLIIERFISTIFLPSTPHHITIHHRRILHQHLHSAPLCRDRHNRNILMQSLLLIPRWANRQLQLRMLNLCNGVTFLGRRLTLDIDDLRIGPSHSFSLCSSIRAGGEDGREGEPETHSCFFVGGFGRPRWVF
jgi:hypothetical protein